MMKMFLYGILAFLVLYLSEAHAQLPAPAPKFDFALTNKTLNGIEKQILSGKIERKQTSEILENLDTIKTQIAQEKSQALDELETILKKLKALDTLSDTDDNEPQEIKSQRKNFNLQADKIRTKIANAELAKAKIDEINDLILKQRNSQLFNDIMLKESSILAPNEFATSLLSFFKFIYELVLSPFRWFDNLSAHEQKIQRNSLTMVVFLLMAVWLFTYQAGYFIKKHYGYAQDIDLPNSEQKLKAALWEWLARGGISASALICFLLWIGQEHLIISSDFGLFLQNLALFVLYFIVLLSLAKVILSPYRPKWRLAPLMNDRAISLYKSLHFACGAICIITFFQTLATEMKHDVAIIYALTILSNAVKAFCIALISIRAFYTSPTEDVDNDDTSLDTRSKLSLGICIFILFAFGLSLLGYVSLSEFIINKFIGAALIGCGFYILNKILVLIFHLFLKLKLFSHWLKISKKNLLKIELWLKIILTPFIWLVAILCILAFWGVSVDIFLLNLKSFLIGFNFGGVHISIISIFLGILAFFISLFVFKLLKNSFISGNLSQIDMDEGIKSSLVAGIGFFGFFISLILAIAVMGGSFESIAIIAGALSLGAGLGLQNMVSNLVAGLTILFERPLKPGDWVIINGQEGVVKQINIRSTTLEAPNKADIIIPNSEIISSSLVNLTYGDKVGKAEINVSVAYDCDIELVKQTLIDIALQNPFVMKNPVPGVSVSNFSSSGLELQLNCFLANVYNKGNVTNDIKEDILKKFRELGINFPTPCHIVRISK